MRMEKETAGGSSGRVGETGFLRCDAIILLSMYKEPAWGQLKVFEGFPLEEILWRNLGANDLGKAIILKNLTILAMRWNNWTTAERGG